MNNIIAKVIADSKNEWDNRITTMIVTMPRIILAEFNTHRMFSRNSASSRAIPFDKMVKSVQENPFIPIAWQKDHKGMQGNEYITYKNTVELIKEEWVGASQDAILRATRLHSGKIASDNNLECDIVTKQLCNRLLEPFMYHTVICTATEWENFFALRCPQYQFSENPKHVYRSWKDLQNSHNNIVDDSLLNRLQTNKGQAEIHMMALAEAMWDAYNESIPKELKAGEWYIPFGDDIDAGEMIGISDYESIIEQKIKIATARCARISYTVVGEECKEPNYENDIKLHDRLADSGHWSPFEHCAKTMSQAEREMNRVVIQKQNDSDNLGWSGNFKGFIQYRKTFNNENIR